MEVTCDRKLPVCLRPPQADELINSAAFLSAVKTKLCTPGGSGCLLCGHVFLGQFTDSSLVTHFSQEATKQKVLSL